MLSKCGFCSLVLSKKQRSFESQPFVANKPLKVYRMLGSFEIRGGEGKIFKRERYLNLEDHAFPRSRARE